MSIYVDHSVKFSLLRHKLYHVVSSKMWIILHMPTVKSTCYPLLYLVRPLSEIRYLTMCFINCCIRGLLCLYVGYVDLSNMFSLLMLCFYLICSCQHKEICEVAKPMKMPWVFNVTHFFNFHCMVK